MRLPLVCSALAFALGWSWTTRQDSASQADAAQQSELLLSPAGTETLERRLEMELRLVTEVLEHKSERSGVLTLPPYPESQPLEQRSWLVALEKPLEGAGAAPLGLERTYREWRAQDGAGNPSLPYAVDGALVGRSVRFRLSEAGVARELVPASDSALATPEAENVEKLAVALDWHELLPPAQLLPGESWEIELGATANLWTPGLEASRLEGSDALDWLARLGALPEGISEPRLMGKYRELLVQGQERTAVLEYMLEHRSPRTASAAERTRLGRQIGGGAELSELELQHEIELTISGQVLWDATAGHLRSGELKAQFIFLRRFAAALRLPDDSSDTISAEQRIQAEVHLQATCK